MTRKTSQANALRDRIKAARGEAARLPAGPEKDALLGQAEQDEVALRVIQWMTSSGHVAAALGLAAREAAPTAAELTKYEGSPYL